MKNIILAEIPKNFFCITDIAKEHYFENPENKKKVNEFLRTTRVLNIITELRKKYEYPIVVVVNKNIGRKTFCCLELKEVFERWILKINISGILLKQNEFTSFIKKSFGGKFDVKTEVNIGQYRVDILINNKLIIEFDEYYHNSENQKEKDLIREFNLTKIGYKIIRHNHKHCISGVFGKIIQSLY